MPNDDFIPKVYIHKKSSSTTHNGLGSFLGTGVYLHNTAMGSIHGSDYSNNYFGLLNKYPDWNTHSQSLYDTAKQKIDDNQNIKPTDFVSTDPKTGSKYLDKTKVYKTN